MQENKTEQDSCQPEVFALFCLRALCKRFEERHQRSKAKAGGYIFCGIIDRHKISVLQCAYINLVEFANRSMHQNNDTIPALVRQDSENKSADSWDGRSRVKKEGRDGKHIAFPHRNTHWLQLRVRTKFTEVLHSTTTSHCLKKFDS
jgi:hypothetical protein